MSHSPPPLRLAFVAHSFPASDADLSRVGGMQRVAADLLDAFERRSDLRLFAYVFRAPGWQHRWGGVFFFYVATLARLLWKGWRRELDAIIFSSMVTGVMAPVLTFFLRTKTPVMVAIAHGHDVLFDGFGYPFLVSKALKTLDGAAPVSRSTAEALLDRGLPEERCRVIHNGIDFSRFPDHPPLFEERRTVLKAIFGQETLPEGAFLMAGLGRQIPRKGYAWFINTVMPTLPPHIHLWIAGDGPQIPLLEAARRAHGLESRVRLLKSLPQPSVQALYRGCDLFLMPNVKVSGDCEGFGVVLLEAGLNGAPVLAARLEGIIDAVHDGITGILVESENSQAYTDIILELEKNQEKRRELSASTHHEITKTRGWDNVAQQHLGFVRDILLKK